LVSRRYQFILPTKIILVINITKLPKLSLGRDTSVADTINGIKILPIVDQRAGIINMNIIRRACNITDQLYIPVLLIIYPIMLSRSLIIISQCNLCYPGKKVCVGISFMSLLLGQIL
jgi:hypothetical protein